MPDLKQVVENWVNFSKDKLNWLQKKSQSYVYAEFDSGHLRMLT